LISGAVTFLGQGLAGENFDPAALGGAMVAGAFGGAVAGELGDIGAAIVAGYVDIGTENAAVAAATAFAGAGEPTAEAGPTEPTGQPGTDDPVSVEDPTGGRK
jgi:hypothetical protein